MKKLLLTTLAVLLSLSLFGRPRELNPKVIDKAITDWVLEGLRELGYTVLPEVIVQDTLNRKGEKSNYEKYWESKNGTLDKSRHEPKPEFDDLYFQPSKDRKGNAPEMKQKPKKDTLEKKQIIVNNYYDNDFYYANRINRFHHGFYFDFYSPFYSPYYSWYSPYVYDSWYWGYNSWYGWNFSFGWHSPYYGWYSPYNYRWYTPYYIHTPYYGYNQPRYNNVQYGRRERPSNFTQTNTTSRRIAESQSREVSQQRVAPQNKPTYDQNRRTYAPSYEQPRMSTRPQYNNSRIQRDNTNVTIQRSTETRTQISTERRTTQPQMNKSQNYSAPSRSYSAPIQRSSNYNNSSSMDRRSSGNFNSGSNMNRSSNFSSGSNGSSSSGSSGGRTSGGSSSSGRR